VKVQNGLDSDLPSPTTGYGLQVILAKVRSGSQHEFALAGGVS